MSYCSLNLQNWWLIPGSLFSVWTLRIRSVVSVMKAAARVICYLPASVLAHWRWCTVFVWSAGSRPPPPATVSSATLSSLWRNFPNHSRGKIIREWLTVYSLKDWGMSSLTWRCKQCKMWPKYYFAGLAGDESENRLFALSLILSVAACCSGRYCLTSADMYCTISLSIWFQSSCEKQIKRAKAVNGHIITHST